MRATKQIDWLVFLIGLLALAALACNAPIGVRATLPPPPTPGGPAATVTTGITPTAPDSTPTGERPTAAPLPTFTPIPTRAAGTPLPGQEHTPTVTATPTITATTTITPTPTASGPLGFTYEIVWTTTPDANGNVIAQVTITAFGGTGEYLYYHDDILQEGPVFRYRWAACRDNPGSFRVDSGNDSIRVNYFERPPCPSTP